MKKLIVLLTVLFGWVFFSFSLSAQTNSSDGYKLRTVVIDAGHGGKDPGAIGTSGLQEKDVALAVSLMVGNYIKDNFPEVKVLYTRDSDVFIPLYERGKMARDQQADLFISIHTNSYTDKSVRGTEVYVLGLHKSETSLNLAIKENASIFLEDNFEDNYDYDPDNPQTHIKMTMGINANINQSILLASNLNDQFVDRVHRDSRGVKQAGFIVLHQNTCPSILIELGFLTNSNEEEYLRSENGQVYMASAIYRAFKDYKTTAESSNLPPVNQVAEYNAEPAETNNKVSSTEGVVIKVQFMIDTEKIQEGHPKLKGISNYEIEGYDNGMYRYLSGSFNSIKIAQKHKDEIIAKGINDAFLVAYQNGERISISEAFSTLKK